MYKNRISRITPNSHPQFFIRRSDIAFDQRIAFIESVCATLIESRFGPGRIEPVVINLKKEAEREPAAFYDLQEGEDVPFYAILPLGRKISRVVEAGYQRAKQMGFVAVASHGSSLAGYSSNLGRGSP